MLSVCSPSEASLAKTIVSSTLHSFTRIVFETRSREVDWAMVVCTQHSPAALPDATPLSKAWLTISEDMKAKLISLPARLKEYVVQGPGAEDTAVVSNENDYDGLVEEVRRTSQCEERRQRRTPGTWYGQEPRR